MYRNGDGSWNPYPADRKRERSDHEAPVPMVVDIQQNNSYSISVLPAPTINVLPHTEYSWDTTTFPARTQQTLPFQHYQYPQLSDLPSILPAPQSYSQHSRQQHLPSAPIIYPISFYRQFKNLERYYLDFKKKPYVSEEFSDFQSQATMLFCGTINLIKNTINTLKAWERQNKPSLDIANILFGCGGLANLGLLNLSAYPTVNDFNLFLNLLSHLSDLIERSEKPTQEIANALYGAGQLAERGILDLNAHEKKAFNSSINALFAILLEKINTTDVGRPTQHIANALYGAGQLAKRGILDLNAHEKKAFSRSVNALFAILSEKINIIGIDKPTQAIANALCGAGQLAERGMLDLNGYEKKAFNSLINALFAILLEKINTTDVDRPTQHIANALYGAGQLAERGVLDISYLRSDEKIKFNSSVNALFTILSEKINTTHDNKPTQAIANALYGAGQLAKRGILDLNAHEKKAFNRSVNALFAILLEKINTTDVDRPTQHIANALYGAGQLAKRGILDLNAHGKKAFNSLINALFAILLEKINTTDIDRPTQHIANALYGAGQLAERGILDNTFDFTAISSLLDWLSAQNIESITLLSVTYITSSVDEMKKKGLRLSETQTALILALRNRLPANHNQAAQPTAAGIEGAGLFVGGKTTVDPLLCFAQPQFDHNLRFS